MRRLLQISCAGVAALALSAAAEEKQDADTSPVAGQWLEDIGYDLGDADDKAVAEKLKRFETITGSSGEASSEKNTTSLFNLLQRGALKRGLPCPRWAESWAAEQAGSEEVARVVITFRGTDIARQMTAASDRMAECYSQIEVPARQDRDGDPRLLIARSGRLLVTAESPSELPPEFARFASLAAGAAPPAQDVAAAPLPKAFVAAVNLDSAFPVRLTKPNGTDPTTGAADIGEPSAPTIDEIDAACRNLGLERGCIARDAIAADYGPWSPELQNRPILSYSGSVKSDLGEISFRAPASIASLLGDDLAETAILKSGLDGYRSEAKPKFKILGDGMNGIEPGEKFAENPLCENGKGDGDFGLWAQRALMNFWNSLGDRDWLQRWFSRTGDYNIDFKDFRILIVDKICESGSGAVIGASNPACNQNRQIRTPEMQSSDRKLELNKDWYTPGGSGPLEHTYFAADIIGAPESALPVQSGGRPNTITGLAHGARIDAVSPEYFHHLLQSARESLNSYRIVVVTYDSERERCFIPDSFNSSDPEVDQIAVALSNYLFNEQRNASSGAPLFVLALSQSPGQRRNCHFLDNRDKVGAVANDKNAASVDTHFLHGEDTAYTIVPAFYYPANPQTDNHLSRCVGAHCDLAYGNTIAAAALDTDNTIRNDTRLTFKQPVMAAPGTNIISFLTTFTDNGEADTSKVRFSAQCGTSFAAPVVAGIAANSMKKHNLNARRTKLWLAATARIPPTLAAHARAGMISGVANLQRSYQSDPTKYNIWMVSDQAGPRQSTNPPKSGEVDIDQLINSNIVENQSRWTGMQFGHQRLALVRDGNNTDKFYYVWAEPNNSSPKVFHNTFSFNNKPATCGEHVSNLDRVKGCLKFDGEDLPIAKIEQIIFPLPQ